MSKQFVACAVVLLVSASMSGQQIPGSAGLTAGAKIFINPMPDDFDAFLKTALIEKRVPLVVVENKNDAMFEISGTSETQKAGAAKKVFMLSWHSDEQASISIANLESGEIVFAYSVNKKNSARGKQSTAEACAKHIKEEIQKRK